MPSLCIAWLCTYILHSADNGYSFGVDRALVVAHRTKRQHEEETRINIKNNQFYCPTHYPIYN